MSNETNNLIYPAVIIGVGETGLDSLKLIKKKFAECGHTDNKVPEIIRLIHIETRDESNKKIGTDADIVQCRLDFNYDKISAIVSDEASVKTWLDIKTITGGNEKDFNPALLQNTRTLGRLALFSSFGEIKKVLEDALNVFNKYPEFNKDNIPLSVFIILPFNCVTASAIALDLAYIVKQIVFDKTVERICEVNGYFLMPDAFCETSQQILESAKINTVAALKEIDSFMVKTSLFDAAYPEGYGISPQIGIQKPYDFAYLISAVNINSEEIIKQVIVEKIFHMAGSALTSKSNKFLANISVNAFKIISEGEFIGSPVNYSSFGVASCAIPVEKLVDAYFNKFTAPFTEKILAAPYCKNEDLSTAVSEEVEKFSRKYGLINGGIDDIIEKICAMKEVQEKCTLDYDEMNFDSSGTVAVNRVKTPEKTYTEFVKKISADCKTLENNMISDFNNTLANSLIDPKSRTFPFCVKFCEALLNAVSPLREKINNEIVMLDVGQTALLGSAVVMSKKISILYMLPWFIRSKKILIKTSRLYIETTNQIFKNRLRRDALSFCYEAVKAFESELNKAVEALKNILSALDELHKSCSAKPGFGDFAVNDKDYNWLLNYSVVDESHIAYIYENHVGDPVELYKDFFNDDFFIDSAGWLNCSNNKDEALKKIKNVIGRVIKNKLKRSLTIEEFLIWRGKNTGENELQKRCEALAAQGDILWRLNTGLFSTKMTQLNLIGTFDSDKTLINQELKANMRKDIQIVTNNDPHRLTLIQMAHGAPLFALKQMPEWEDLYKRKVEKSTAHVIKENNDEISFLKYDIRPVALGTDAMLAYFTMADIFEYIKSYKVEGKNNYFLTLDPSSDYDPDKPLLNEILGRNRAEAIKTFSYSAKLRSVVNRVICKLSKYEAEGKKDNVINKIISILDNAVNSTDDDETKKQITCEIEALQRFFKFSERKLR